MSRAHATTAEALEALFKKGEVQGRASASTTAALAEPAAGGQWKLAVGRPQQEHASAPTAAPAAAARPSSPPPPVRPTAKSTAMALAQRTSTSPARRPWPGAPATASAPSAMRSRSRSRSPERGGSPWLESGAGWQPTQATLLQADRQALQRELDAALQEGAGLRAQVGSPGCWRLGGSRRWADTARLQADRCRACSEAPARWGPALTLALRWGRAGGRPPGSARQAAGAAGARGRPAGAAALDRLAAGRGPAAAAVAGQGGPAA
jgi:hypothetical protein